MYLYRGWDDSLYLTELPDGSEGLVMKLVDKTTFQHVADYVGLTQACYVFDAYFNGSNAVVEVYI